MLKRLFPCHHVLPRPMIRTTTFRTKALRTGSRVSRAGAVSARPGALQSKQTLSSLSSRSADRKGRRLNEQRPRESTAESAAGSGLLRRQHLRMGCALKCPRRALSLASATATATRGDARDTPLAKKISALLMKKHPPFFLKPPPPLYPHHQYYHYRQRKHRYHHAFYTYTCSTVF
jgi:hypothetical protein